MKPMVKLAALGLLTAANGSAQALTVLCWGQGIPCFDVSNCGGYPACTGSNQPCCLGGGTAAFSDLNVGAGGGTGAGGGITIVGDRPGGAVIDLFSEGKLIDERYLSLPTGRLPVTANLDGVDWDFLRVYVDTPAKAPAECLALPLAKRVKCEPGLPPAVYRIEEGAAPSRVRLAPDAP